VTNDRSGTKVYVEIVHQIQSIIADDRLKTGDKLPSERELSERLKVGRSSVREALRALELLGLIETRRGEGTFLRDFHNHQLIDLLGAFILQDPTAKADLVETKKWIEMQAMHKLSQNIEEFRKKWPAWIFEYDASPDSNAIMGAIIASTHNQLLSRIWLILNEFSQLPNQKLTTERELHDQLCSWLEYVDNKEKETVRNAVDDFIVTLFKTNEIDEKPKKEGKDVAKRNGNVR
jgi:GntR family transcriptional repressor for pyruvate dehydrogenase complex